MSAKKQSASSSANLAILGGGNLGQALARGLVRSGTLQPEQIHVGHILLTGPDAATEAAAAHDRLAAGEDLATLARELSQDEATRDQGGDLGFFPRGRMLAPFEEAAFALEPGALSAPVETERGVHLIRLEERRAGVDKKLEDVAEELARELLRDERARSTARAAAEQSVVCAQRQGARFFECLGELERARALRAERGASASREIEACLGHALALVTETGGRAIEPQVIEERARLAALRGDDGAGGHQQRCAARHWRVDCRVGSGGRRS